MASQPDDLTRKFDELWKKGFDSVGVRVAFRPAQWPENLKALRAGKVQFWFLGSSAASSNGQGALARLFGPQAGNSNLAFFRNAEFDRIYERMRVIPDGPEREALFLKAKRIAVAYMPYKHTVHRMEADMLHPWVVGYRRPLFALGWWHRVDIDNSKRAEH
jgi:ABC-type transport system substrate-binding protein